MTTWIVLLLALQTQGLQEEGKVHRLDLAVEIRPLVEGLWLHRSTNEDGFPSNGLIAEIEGESLLVDTAYTDAQTDVILNWARDVLGRPISEAISTHGHVDRVGGLGALQRRGVEAWALDLTAAAVRKEESRPPAALFRAADGVHTDPRGFEVYYPGPGHVTDNVVVYFPEQRVLFGGCLIKSSTAEGLGYIEEADLEAWPATLERVRERYASAETVVPGHGRPSGLEAVTRSLALLRAHAAAALATEERPELGRHFADAGAEGAFVLFDAARRTFVRYNPTRARQRFLPASTFKIPNSLIALETGVVADEHAVFPWDGTERWLAAWNRDHDLASAFAASAVWVYQEIARRIGEERMRDFVSRLGYGNGDIAGGIDLFWLSGALRISAEEQIDFLRRLESGDLPFSERTIEIVRRIMKLGEGEGWVVRGKTGWAPRDAGHDGWYVGWVEKGEGRYFFALQVSSDDEDFPMFQARREILGRILGDLGLPAP